MSICSSIFLLLDFEFQAGDLILAVFLNLPAFLAGKNQLTKSESIFSRKIAGCRIHVDRALERSRNYKIVDLITAP